jgi:hypothetical protein
VTAQSGAHDDTGPGAVRLSRSSPAPATVVIGVGGELDAATEPTARTFTTAQLVHRPGHVIVDVSEVTFLGSAGLSRLLDLRGTARGNRLRPPPRRRRPQPRRGARAPHGRAHRPVRHRPFGPGRPGRTRTMSGR